MPEREFAGPRIGAARLFPLNATSLLVSLGGTGKTTVAMKFAAHIAAGKNWDFVTHINAAFMENILHLS
jgi:hypothetical protein